MFTLTLIPSITITPAEDPNPATSSATATSTAHPLGDLSNFNTTPRTARRHSTAAVLPVPPLAAAHDDRLSLAQRGLPVGSYKLNCVESIGALSPPRLSGKSAISGAATPSNSAASSPRGSTKPFSWTTTGGAFTNETTSSHSHSRSRHSRAKSLNSLAELGIPTPNPPSPAVAHEAYSRRSRHRSLGVDMNMALGDTKFSIDLAVLDSTPSPSEQGFHFSFARRF